MNVKVDSTAQRIVEAAGRVFAERGYAAATVREICTSAACNVASVNYYFGDKSKLYVECVLTAYRQRDEILPLHSIDQSRPPEEELRNYIRTILCRVLAKDGECWQARLLLHETLRPTESTVPLLREYFRPSFEEFVGLLKRLPNSSSCSEPLDTELVIYTVVGQCLFYRVGRPFIRLLTPEWEQQGMDLERLTDHVTASVLGLFRSPRSSGSGNLSRSSKTSAVINSVPRPESIS